MKANKPNIKMMSSLPVLILLTAAIYIVLLFDVTIEFSKRNIRHTLKYTGLVWVALDYYTIWKYDSSDEPMKWIEYKCEQVNDSVL